MGFPAHEGRPGALGEVHARPHPLIETPRVLVQLAFMTEGGSGVDHGRAFRTVAAPRHRRARPSCPPSRHEVGQGLAALGTAHGILDLSVGRAACRKRQGAGRLALRQRIFAARHGHLRHQARNPQMDAGERKADRRLRSDQPVLFAGRARQRRHRHRFPPGRRRPDPHAGARPRPDAGAHRCAVAAADRHRDLPHAGHARPAAGADAVGPRPPHRRQAGADHAGNEGRRDPRQPDAAGRPDRACRRTGGRCRLQPLPLRRQPRL